MLPELPPTFATTRDALHAVAEHVLAAARFRSTGHIGLIATHGGFGTPPNDDTRIWVEGDDLVDEHAGRTRRTGITTVRAAAEFVGIEPGLPPGVYQPATPFRPDELLDVEPGAALALGAWYAHADAALHQFAARHARSSPSEIQLWPEHFDIACDLGDTNARTRGTYGASPGDVTIAEPYLYVAPWDKARRTGRFGQFPFGAALGYTELAAAADPDAATAQFFDDCAAALLG